MKNYLAIAVFAVLTSAGLQAMAQESDVSKAYMEAHERMMSQMMSVKPSGDADMDFVMMMIPHHEGAIEMAAVELKYGKDPTLKKIAQQIIDTQKKEIEEFKKWQTEHGM